MGGAWSLFFCQDVLVGRCIAAANRMRGTSSEHCDRIVVDGRCVAPMGRGKPLWLPYVDNGNCWAWGSEYARAALDVLRWSFSDVGLVVRLEGDIGPTFEVRGLTFDGPRRLVVNKVSRR